MSIVHFEDTPHAGMACGLVFAKQSTGTRQDVTCMPCLAALQGEDEAWAWRGRPSRPAGRHRGTGDGYSESRHGGSATVEGRLRRNLDQVSEVERLAAAGAGEWNALLADAMAVRRHLSAQLGLVQGVRGTPTPTAPVNAVQDVSGRPAPTVVANPYARHDMSWNPSGTGLCGRLVARPGGTIGVCGERPESPVHG